MAFLRPGEESNEFPFPVHDGVIAPVQQVGGVEDIIADAQAQVYRGEDAGSTYSFKVEK